MKITPQTIFTRKNIREPLTHPAYVAVTLVSPLDDRVHGRTTIKVPTGGSIFDQLTRSGYNLHSVDCGVIRVTTVSEKT